MNRFALLLLALPTAIFADDPFDCVDPDIVEAFLGNWYQNRPNYSTSIPDDFVKMGLPAHFTLVGSAVHGSSVSVVYKTEENANAALSSVVDVMENDGWRNVSEINRMQRGFQTRSMPKMATVCRDTEPGLLSIAAKEQSGQTLLSFSVHSYTGSQSCNDLMPKTRVGHGMTLMTYLPVLNLPEDAQTSHTGAGGSGDEANSRVVISTTMSREGLLSFLGDQIRSQQWVFDTSWSGNLSSGSVWSMETPDNETLIGTLHIASLSTDAVRVRFSVSSADAGAGAVRAEASSFSIRSN